MGVDTKGIISQNITVIELSDYIKTKYTNVDVHKTSQDYFFTINFADGNDKRTLYCFWGDVSLHDNRIQGVSLSFGLWGNAIEIMKDLVGHFGGYVDECDSDDIEFYPVNIEKFTADAKLSERELFKHRVISTVGFNALNQTMILCEEYASMKLKQALEKV